MLEFFKSQIELISLGSAIIIFSTIIIAIIRETKTKKDDEVLDKYVVKALEFAISVIPQSTAINKLKLAKNAMAKFVEIYHKEKQKPMDETTLKWAYKEIMDTAKKMNGTFQTKK